MASYAMQAHHYDPDKPIPMDGYCASRKLNGFRGIFKPGEGLFSLGRYSGSKEIYAPKWWLDQLPPLALDGEIWHESDDLAFVKSIAGQGKEKSLVDPRWNQLTFQAFDLRNPMLYWRDRQSQLYRYKDNDVFKKVEQTPVFTVEDIEDYMEELGPQAEGCMLARPKGMYVYNRSWDILKHKRKYDAEATVVGAVAGEGKHTGRVGALMCELVWDAKIASVKGGLPEMVGKQVAFNVGGGLTDDQRDVAYFANNLSGKLIKFSYLGVSRYGVPQSPNFLEVI